jgi:hypothetical protein
VLTRICLTALPLVLACAAPARAQDAAIGPAAADEVEVAPTVDDATDQAIEFSSDRLEYDDRTGLVTASAASA